jgi:Flp pilus assembly CpaE family ATPase
MKSADALVLMTEEKETAAAVRAVLESGSVAVTPDLCDAMMELRTRLSKAATGNEHKVAIVDIDADPDHILFELSKVIATYPHTRFIVISKDFSEKLVLHAMQIGARHFLRKNSIPAELGKVLERLLGRGSQGPERLGSILSVFSCSGGCGATMAAINIANELRLAHSKQVLVVDLDPHYGSVSTYLAVKGEYGIGHILARQGTVDSHVIQSTAINYCSGFDILLSPASAPSDAGITLDFGNLPAALEACREAYDYVVVDAPRIPQPVMADLASISRVGVVVFQLTVRDVAYASSLVSFLAERGIPRERIVPLANRTRRRGPLLKLEDSRRAIGASALYPIRSNWAKAMKSVNRALPLADVARRSGLRRDYRRLAAQIYRCTSNGNP